MQIVALNHLINLYNLHLYEFKTIKTKGRNNAVSGNTVIDTKKAVLSGYIIIEILSLANCFPYQSKISKSPAAKKQQFWRQRTWRWYLNFSCGLLLCFVFLIL